MVNERIIILGVISDWLIVGQLGPALQPEEAPVILKKICKDFWLLIQFEKD